MSVEDAKAALAVLEGKLSDAMARRDKVIQEISRADAAASAACSNVGRSGPRQPINAARNSLRPLNKQATEIDSEIALIRLEIPHARRQFEMAENAAAAKRAPQNGEAVAVADKWFEISCPDGRKIRRRGASLESMQSGLQQGYAVVGRVFAANPDGSGGFLDSSLLAQLLDAQGDALMAFLAARGIGAAAP